MSQEPENSNQHLSISIFHTNDMHGRLEAIARLAAFSRKLKENARAGGYETFLWDAGDAADRSIRICGTTKGAAFQGILNAMGYTLQTMGNAIAVTYGPQAMAEIASRSAFPILAANCRDGNAPLVEGLSEFELISLQGGLSMGVIGLTSPLNGVYEIFGLHFPDFLSVARRLVSKLRADGVSVVIVLSHLGLPEDRRLADEVDGIDVIIGAHTHDRLEHGEERNGVLITQAGQYAEAIGRVDISVDRSSRQLVSKTARVYDVSPDLSPDPAVLAAIDTATQELTEILSQTIGEISADLDIDYFNECGLGDMAADALRGRMNADIALLASGLFHAPIARGKLTFGGLDAACFSTANPYLSEVRGTQILEALERGLNSSISKFELRGLRGPPMGIPQVSGMVVEYSGNPESNPRVQRVLVNGDPLDLNHFYRVAHTDVEIVPDVGYLVLQDNQILSIEVPTILREVLADYIRDHSPVKLPLERRWILVPEN